MRVKNQTLGGDLLMELTAQVNQVKTRASSENSWVGDGTEQISLNVGEKKVTFKVTEADGALEPINEENQLFWPVPLKPQTVTAWYPQRKGIICPRRGVYRRSIGSRIPTRICCILWQKLLSKVIRYCRSNI